MPDERSSSSRSHHRHSRDSRSRSPDRNRSSTSTSSRSRSRSHRDRSRSPARSSSHRKDRNEESDSGEEGGPPEGVDDINSEDFFVKATELKLWLWEEKGKKLDSLKNEDARRYFKKFCKAWNRGRLSPNFYSGISPASVPSSISTSHTWNFKKASQSELDTAASVRRSIEGSGSKVRSYDATGGSGSSGVVVGPSQSRSIGGGGGGPRLGPTLPPSSAVERLQLERDGIDSSNERQRQLHTAERRRSNRESREEERDNRSTGKDRLIEKRREGNLSRREFEQSREGGGMVDVPEEVLMGTSGGSFQDALKERERSKMRKEGWKANIQEEKKAVLSDKYAAHRQKEDATMAQFKALAAARFGPAPP